MVHHLPLASWSLGSAGFHCPVSLYSGGVTTVGVLYLGPTVHAQRSARSNKILATRNRTTVVVLETELNVPLRRRLGQHEPLAPEAESQWDSQSRIRRLSDPKQFRPPSQNRVRFR